LRYPPPRLTGGAIEAAAQAASTRVRASAFRKPFSGFSRLSAGRLEPLRREPGAVSLRDESVTAAERKRRSGILDKVLKPKK